MLKTLNTRGRLLFLSIISSLTLLIGLVLLFIIPAFAATAPTPYDGTPVTPTVITSENYELLGLTEESWEQYNGYYAIRNAKELYGFAEIVNNMSAYASNTNAVLLQDIVVNSSVSSGATYTWTPIGSGTYNGSGKGASYSGTFDGNGYTISGLYVNGGDKVGLFGSVGSSSAHIKNLVIADSYFEGANYVGAVVGYMLHDTTTISNCKVDSDVDVVASESHVGGIVGGAYTTSSMYDNGYNVIQNCVNFGWVKLETSDRAVGAIVSSRGAKGNAGFALVKMENCYFVEGRTSNANGTQNNGYGDDGYSSYTGSEGCTILATVSDSHTCISAEHKATQGNCTYTGLSAYSFCLICGNVTNGQKSVVESTTHYYEGGDCLNEETCVLCGEKGNKYPDNHASKETYYALNESDPEKHDLRHSCCHAIIKTEGHEGGTATCLTKAVCTLCKKEYGEVNSSVHAKSDYVYTTTKTTHTAYHACCNAEADTANHEYNESFTCKVCQYKCTHSLIDGENCAYCGADGISYVHREWDGSKLVEEMRVSDGIPTTVTSDTTTMESGWYVVYGNVEVSSRIAVNGTVHLILADGATLNATAGFNLEFSNTLYIYATSADKDTMGKLIAIGGRSDAAGIGGGSQNHDGGIVTINGGIVTATGGYNAAGIGGSSVAAGGTVTINGGIVTATGGYKAAGIGGGVIGNGGTVIINGGTVTATGDSGANDIGMGKSGTIDGVVVITGGNIKANSIGGTPKDNNGNDLTLMTITLDVAKQVAVTAVEGLTYGVKDVHTLDSNKLYFYLPADTLAPTSITAGGKVYGCLDESSLTYSEHSWVDATCQAPKTCSVCGATEGDPHTPDYVDGICSLCGIDESGVHHHSFTAEGFCKFCNAYQPATLVTAEKLVELKLDEAYLGYYAIENAGQLYWFAALTNGTLTDGTEQNASANAVLLNDITVNETVFDEDGKLVSDTSSLRAWTPISDYPNNGNQAYTGIFDGQGYTISGLFCNRNENYAALIGRTSSAATVKNVTVADSYFSATQRAAAIVGWCEGKVENCASVGCVITTTGGRAGGIVGILSGGTVNNCYNTSSVSGTERVGGICGVNQYSSIITNCYNIGKITADSLYGGICFIVNGENSVNAKVENCYDNGDVNSVLMSNPGNYGTITNVVSKTTAQFENGEVAWLLNGGSSEGVWKQTLGTDSSPNFTGDTVYTGTCAGVTFYSNEEGLSYTSHDSVDGYCTRCGNYDFKKDETGNYLIYTVEDLKYFADLVNAGNTTASAKLMANIDMSAYPSFTIGSNSAQYGGTFDGNGYTLTLALNGGENTALFGYLNGATIKNLHVAGTITASYKYASGIAAHTYGNTVIENCISSVVITSTMTGNGLQDGTHAGFVGVVEDGTLTINNCAFIGEINGEGTNCCGGFVGWVSATCTIKNSYMAGSFTVSSDGSNTFARSSHTLENCYYLEAFGEVATSGATQKDATAFASGEVAYKLNGTNAGTDAGVWKQTIGKDDYPNFTGDIVLYSEADGYYNKITDVASVTITWTEMSFTYSKGEWDVETMTWQNGGWTADEGCGTVTIENTGTLEIAVEITATINEAYSPITANLSESKFSLKATESKTVTVTLLNEPKEYIETKTTIGTITITLSTVDQTE